MGTYIGSCIHYIVKIQQRSITTRVACVLLLKPHPPPSSAPSHPQQPLICPLCLFWAASQGRLFSPFCPLPPFVHAPHWYDQPHQHCFLPGWGPRPSPWSHQGLYSGGSSDFFSRRKQASVQHPQDLSQWGLQSTLGFIILFTTHNSPVPGLLSPLNPKEGEINDLPRPGD